MLSKVAQQKPVSDRDQDPYKRALIVGDLGRWQSEGRNVASSDDVAYTTLDELDAALLSVVAPHIVLSALVGDSFDAVDIASRLVDMGFTGRYRALAGPTNDTDMIRSEVETIAPNLDFDILEIK